MRASAFENDILNIKVKKKKIVIGIWIKKYDYFIIPCHACIYNSV